MPFKKIERLTERLKQRDYKLKSLLEITRSINETDSTEALLDKYHSVVYEELNITRLVLFIQLDDEWQCALKYGIDKNFDDLDIDSVFGKYREIKSLQTNDNEIFRGFDLLIPVFHDERPLSYLLVGDVDGDMIEVSPIIRHMGFIQTLTNIISVAIENKVLLNKSLEQERFNTELELAAQMQSLLVSSGVKDYNAFEVAIYYKPHHQIGGDFCDFIALNDQEAFLCMADVSGKGVSAAFLMANVQAHLRALLRHTNWTLESIAHELNRRVVEIVNGDRFVTLFMAYFHRPSRALHYINAGHNPPFVIQRDEFVYLEEGTVGLGMLPELPFLDKGLITLAPNALITCYTDGVVELENEKNEDFGNKRLGALVREKSTQVQHIDELITYVVHALDTHRGQMPYSDDNTLLFCRFK